MLACRFESCSLVSKQDDKMKKLFLSRQQAKQLGDDLTEYLKFKDSSSRELFSGFEVSFGDMLEREVCSDQELTMVPIPSFTLIQGEDIKD